MSFIKSQKIIRDADGNITSGSDAIVDTVYIKTGTQNHSKQVVRERLGRIISLSSDKKSGIFLSPTRGLIAYDVVTDTFSEIENDDTELQRRNHIFETELHTVFGDSYLLLEFLKKCGLLSVLRNVFPKDEFFERMLCHVIHGILRDGSKIPCDCFIQKSFISYLTENISNTSLKSDTRYFHVLGDDKIKVSFFKSFVSFMQKDNPLFGKGCYVDSTPLPNNIENNPFNALCCHGVNSSEVMTRLILVLDENSGLPVWYDIIPGNVLDINTIMNTVGDVSSTLGIEIDSLVLDAGYVSKELIQAFHIGTEKKIIGRMPARRGYPHKTLYCEVKDIIGKGKYEFVRKHHAYFGIQKRIRIFEHEMYAYVYVDQYNALKRFSDYLVEHEEEYSTMKVRDKDWLTVRDKDWLTVKYGYFVLLSNVDKSPKDLLSDYFGRTDIEVVFKTGKEYLELLPISKWTDATVRGKILHDIIDTIILIEFRKHIISSGYSTSEIFGRCQSLMCFRNQNGYVTVETASKQVKSYYSMFGVNIPAHICINTYKDTIMKPGGKM